MVTPGFIDSHLHLTDGGRGLQSVQLRDAATPAEFVRRIATHATTLAPGTWITNGDWDHTLWGGELPARAWIDPVTPVNPVWINRLDGHMCLANSAALGAAGVTATTADVAGGAIIRDRLGEPTGLLKDNAMELVRRVIPQPNDAAWDGMLDAAMSHLAERGITSVHTMGRADTGTSWDEVDILRRAHAAGRLRTRVVAQVPLATWKRLRDEVARNGRGDSWLRVDGLKAFVDGALGSRTAAMLEPFTDDPGNTGLFVTPPDSLYRDIRSADAAGLRIAVHAIGDRAIRTLLDIYERVARENGPRDRRFRIEHAQHVAPPDVRRFAEIGVVASMQPYHAADDGRWAEAAVGPERAMGTYAFRSLLDAGATLAFGSDWFVAPPSPLDGIQAAVTRRTLDGRHPGGWVPSQRITLDEALRAYTSGAAYAGFQDSELGILRPGMLADLVLLDRDLSAIPPETIGTAKVCLTMVGGRIVFE